MEKIAQMFHFFRKYWILILILVVAVGARVLALGQLPATFFVDEVLSGYLGRFLWENGKDLYGNSWPLLYFNKFGDYYIILPMYLDGLSTYLFGVNWFATRFPTALIGAVATLPVYAIARQLYGSKAAALLAAGLFAVAPWHVVLSRATTESVLELTLLLTVVLCLLLAVKRQALWLVAVAGALSLLSYFVYHTARLHVPLLWFGYTAIFFSVLRKQQLLLAVAASTVLMFGVTGFIGQTEWGSSRLEQTSIFSEQSGVPGRIQQLTYNLGTDSVFFARVFHNKLLGFGREYVQQYLVYFSPQFLLTEEAWINTRYAVPDVGPLYFAILLMLLAWLVPTNKKVSKSSRVLLLVLWMLIIAPAPAALTVLESPNVRRSILLLVPVLLLAAGGWHRSFSIRYRKLHLGHAIAVVLFAEVILFAANYTKHSDLFSSVFRSDGQPEVARYILDRPELPAVAVMDSIDFPLYYLFEKQDFSASYADRFAFELRIESMDSVYPMKEGCSNALTEEQLQRFPAGTVYIEPERCEVDVCRFAKTGVIQGVNLLTKYQVLNAVSDDPLLAKPEQCSGLSQKL